MRIKHLFVVLATGLLILTGGVTQAQVYNEGWATLPTTAKLPDNDTDISQILISNHIKSYTLVDLARKTPPSQKAIIVDPRKHTWRAISSTGKVLKTGLATAGSSWCGDIGRPCRTRTGTFHIYTLGGSGCKSSKYPVGRGGAPMPYCMFFNGGQGLHGSNEVVPANVSHGCIRLHVTDAKWIRNNFATIGTKVIIKPY
jgi:lipoprotein-anchoring transpeptidase ErfK/SrfK